MFRNGILPRILFALLIFGLLAAGGVGLYRLGFTQGYQTAAITLPAAAQGTGSQAAPLPYAISPLGYGPWAYGPHFWGPGFGFFPFFPFIGIGFLFVYIFILSGLFHRWGHRRWAGGPGYWHHEQEPEEKKAE